MEEGESLSPLLSPVLLTWLILQGKVLDTIEGANAAETSKRVRELAKSGAPKASPTIQQVAEKPKEPLDVRSVGFYSWVILKNCLFLLVK